MMLGIFLGVFYISGYVSLALLAAHGVRKQAWRLVWGRPHRVGAVERCMVHRSSTHSLNMW